MPYRQLPRYFLLYLGALVALGPVAMDAYLPALPTMAEKLGVSIATLSTSVSTFLVGFATGQLLAGPSPIRSAANLCVCWARGFLLSPVRPLPVQNRYRPSVFCVCCRLLAAALRR